MLPIGQCIKYCNSYTSFKREKKQAIGWTWMRLAEYIKDHRSLNMSCHSSFQWCNRVTYNFQRSNWHRLMNTRRVNDPSMCKKHWDKLPQKHILLKWKSIPILSTSTVTAVHSKRDSPKSSKLPCPTWFKASNHRKKTI